MNADQINALFEKHDDEYLKFKRIVNPRHRCPDVAAFLLLAEIAPDYTGDIVTSAEYDVIWLGIEAKDLIDITEDQIIELARCGVLWDNGYESLTMNV